MNQDDAREPQAESLTITQTTHLSGETVKAIERQVAWAAGHWWVVLLAGVSDLIGSSHFQPRWLAVASGILAIIGGLVAPSFKNAAGEWEAAKRQARAV